MRVLAAKFDNCRQFCRLFIDDGDKMCINAANKDDFVFDEMIINDLLLISGHEVSKSVPIEERAIKAFDVFCNIKKWEVK